MIAALVAKLGLEAALAFVQRYWKPILLGSIGVGIAATITIQHWRINALAAARATDQIAINAAVSANAKNTRAIAELEHQAAVDREISALAVKRTQEISAKAGAVIQELENAPHAHDLAGPLFDALGDRLRALDAGRH